MDDPSNVSAVFRLMVLVGANPNDFGEYWYQKAPLQGLAVPVLLVAWKTHDVAPPAPATTVVPNVPATNTWLPWLAHAESATLVVGCE